MDMDKIILKIIP